VRREARGVCVWSVSGSVRSHVETKLVKIRGSTGVDYAHSILYTIYIKLRESHTHDSSG